MKIVYDTDIFTAVRKYFNQLVFYGSKCLLCNCKYPERWSAKVLFGIYEIIKTSRNIRTNVHIDKVVPQVRQQPKVNVKDLQSSMESLDLFKMLENAPVRLLQSPQLQSQSVHQENRG